MNSIGKFTYEQFDEMAQTCKAIGHPVRLNIILLLDQKGELPVNEIMDFLDKDQTAISQHLTKMKLMRFLSSRRKGKFMLYAIRDKGLVKLIQCLDESKISLN